MHTRDEYEENERELLALYRKLSWKNQVRFIGRLSVFVEQEYRTAPAVEPVKYSRKSALQRFIFPKHGEGGSLYYAVESNPRTRAMYAKFGIVAAPYEVFIQEGRPSGNNR